MLLNRAARFMAKFNLTIENMARFKDVQQGSKFHNKEEKEIDNDKKILPFSK